MWEAYRDDESGEPYFYNAATKVTQWEVPDGYAIDEEGALIDLADPTSLAGSSGPRCWFDVKIGASAPRRVVFHLFAGLAPKTADNFRALCTGEAGTTLESKRPLHFKGSRFHRIVPGFMCQGGDITKGDGTGGESIYGGAFDDEWLEGKHKRPFLLSMANGGPNTNTSQFFITTAAAPHLDGKHVVFGEVLRGEDVVRAMEAVGTLGGKPAQEVVVADCGEGDPEGEREEGAAGTAPQGAEGGTNGAEEAGRPAAVAVPAAGDASVAPAAAGSAGIAAPAAVAAEDAEAAQVLAAQPWQRYRDAASGMFYYHHAATGATTWERPREFVDPEEIARAVRDANEAAAAAGLADTPAASAAPAASTHPSAPAAAPAVAPAALAPAGSAYGGGFADPALAAVAGRDESGFLTAEAAAKAAEALRRGVDPRALLEAGASAMGSVISGGALQQGQGQGPGAGGGEYVARATFRSGGKFEHSGHTSHWDKAGLPGDREARQLSHFMDLGSLQGGSKKRQRAPDWKERKRRADEAKAKKRKAWLYED